MSDKSDWQDWILRKNAESAEEELNQQFESLKKAWGDKPKTSSGDWSFKHVGAKKSNEHITTHTFHASYKGKSVGIMHARHESDNINPHGSNMAGSKLKHEAETHLQSHVNDNYDNYVKMKKH